MTGFFERIINDVIPANNNKFVGSEGTSGAILAMRLVKAGGWSPVSCAGNIETSIAASIDYMLDPLGRMPAGTAWLYFTRKDINPFKAAWIN